LNRGRHRRRGSSLQPFLRSVGRAALAGLGLVLGLLVGTAIAIAIVVALVLAVAAWLEHGG
jgi:hypothetical protein